MSYRIVIHSQAQAQAAISAAASVGADITLVSAAGAGAYAGTAWFEAVVRDAAVAFPGVAVAAVIDCADEAGTALAALRAGCRRVVFTGHAEARARLAEIAAATGAVIESRGAPALDLAASRDPEAACRAWLENADREG